MAASLARVTCQNGEESAFSVLVKSVRLPLMARFAL